MSDCCSRVIQVRRKYSHFFHEKNESWKREKQRDERAIILQRQKKEIEQIELELQQKRKEYEKVCKQMGEAHKAAQFIERQEKEMEVFQKMLNSIVQSRAERVAQKEANKFVEKENKLKKNKEQQLQRKKEVFKKYSQERSLKNKIGCKLNSQFKCGDVCRSDPVLNEDIIEKEIEKIFWPQKAINNWQLTPDRSLSLIHSEINVEKIRKEIGMPTVVNLSQMPRVVALKALNACHTKTKTLTGHVSTLYRNVEVNTDPFIPLQAMETLSTTTSYLSLPSELIGASKAKKIWEKQDEIINVKGIEEINKVVERQKENLQIMTQRDDFIPQDLSAIQESPMKAAKKSLIELENENSVETSNFTLPTITMSTTPPSISLREFEEFFNVDSNKATDLKRLQDDISESSSLLSISAFNTNTQSTPKSGLL